MKNYWLKIALGALSIFVVGMVIRAGVYTVKDKVQINFNSSDPISLPLAFVPFKLDGAKLGKVDRVTLLRSDPKHIESVRILVQLADSLNLARLRNCLVAIDDLDRLNEKTTFRCQGPDTAKSGLVRFGILRVQGSQDSFPLLLPAKTVADLRDIRINFRDRGDAAADSITALEESRADSVEAAADRQGDSLSRISDSISEAASRMADSIRNHTREPAVRLR